MRARKCKQVVDFDTSTTTMKEEKEPNPSLDESDKLDRFISVTLAPNRILLEWWPLEKNLKLSLWANTDKGRSVLKVNCELWCIVKSDRQFCGTVYVISWTVALILSSSEYRIQVKLEHMFVSFQDFVGKTRNFSVWMLARFGREGGYT